MTNSRELLAQAADELGYTTDARILREGKGAFIQVNAALRALEAALSTPLDPPEAASFEAGRMAGLEAAIEAAELLFCPMPETPQKRVSNGTIRDVQAAIRNLIQSSQGGAWK